MNHYNYPNAYLCTNMYTYNITSTKVVIFFYLIKSLFMSPVQKLEACSALYVIDLDGETIEFSSGNGSLTRNC